MRHLLPVIPLILALAACAPQPFDATSAWNPLRATGEGRAYRGGMMSTPPGTVFDEFETNAQAAAENQAGAEEETPSGPQTRLPSPASGENPWATIPENPVVTVCYGSAFNSRAEVRAAAMRLCPEGARLELLQSSTFQSDCPLLQPARAAFRCWTDGDGRDAAGSPTPTDGAGDTAGRGQ